MRWIGILLTMFALLGRATASPTAQGGVLLRYAIAARLDPTAHTVSGTETIRWTNPGNVPVGKLVFHLYMNAFAGPETRLTRESGGQHRHNARGAASGDIVIKRIALEKRDLLSKLVVDETLATLTLPAPLAPGATIELELEFVTTLPGIWIRTGYADRFFAVGQWFPKLAVYECPRLPGCGFVAQQFHAWSEFYADFGAYQVDVDVPSDYHVAGVGEVARDEVKGDRRIVTFVANDVHDFSWFASPDVTTHRRVVDVAGRRVELELFAGRGAAPNVARHLEAAATGLQQLATWLPPYPYPKLTIVIPPAAAADAGGMEYPTLITGFASPAPPFLRADELVTLHELAHQWFYGLVASNEPEEAWLDEGLTEFVSSRIIDEQYGGMFLLGPLRVPMTIGHWLSVARHAAYWPVAIPSYAYPTGAAYSSTTYGKTATILRLWEDRLGRALFDQRLAGYVRKFLYRHPKRADFVAEMARDDDERELLDALLSLDQPIDYAVAELTVVPDGVQTIARRTGPALAPATIVLHHRDGRSEERVWTLANQRQSASVTLSSSDDTEWAEVLSPLQPLDPQPSNDARRLRPSPRTSNALERAALLVITMILGLVGP